MIPGHTFYRRDFPHETFLGHGLYGEYDLYCAIFGITSEGFPLHVELSCE